MNGNRHLSSSTPEPVTPEHDSRTYDATPVGVVEVRPHIVIPDDVADDIVAELREIENVAHE